MPRKIHKPVQQFRGTTAQHATYTGPIGELTVDTDKKVVVVQDGATAGGIPMAREDRKVAGDNYIKVNGAAEGTLAADLTLTMDMTKVAADLVSTGLGFTPVQQGGGTGQGSDKIYIGYSESGLKAQADILDLGNVVTTSAGCTKAPSAALADNATNARNLVVTDDGQTAKFNWNGRYTGQPEWVWGGNAAEFGNMYTWNPANFSVNYATNSNNAWQTTIVPNVAFVGRDGAIPNGGTWLYIYVPYDNHYLRGVTLAGGATTPSNDGGIAIRIA